MVGIMKINQMRIIEKIQQKIFTRYAFAFTEKIPRIDLLELDKYYLPEKVNRFFDTLNVQKGLSKILLDIPTASIQILFGLILLSLYHPIFIVFGLVLVVILYTILKLTSVKGLSSSFEESHYKYAVVAWLEEMAKVIKSFKFSQGTHFNLQKTDNNVTNYLRARTSHFKVLMFQYKTLVFFKVAITAAMLVVGTSLLLSQQLNIGEFIAAEIVILSVINAVEKLIINLDSAYDVLTGLEKLSTITESVAEKEGNITLDTENGIDIEIKNLSFSYQQSNQIFSNLNLNLSPNQLINIYGEDSSGKSTLIKLLSGSYRTFEGNILFNHIPLQNYKLESLRKNIGIFLNQQEIFTGTVLENIHLGRTHISSNQIIDIAKELGIEDFIKNLPDGFETIVDTAGKKLSSSLLKKILLLRAICHQPKLLLLEEPLFGLDTRVNDKILNYLKKYSKRNTVIVISENEIIQHICDLKIELKNGIGTLKHS